MNISANNILNKYWDKKLPVDVFSICDKNNIKLVSNFFGTKTTTITYKKYISYNSNHDLYFQRFFIAHSLGHIISGHLDFRESLNDDKNSYNFNSAQPLEKQANDFALNLLVPSDYLKHAINKLNITSIDSLSNGFAVPTFVIQYLISQLK